MATIDERTTETTTAQPPKTGADVLVEGLVRHGVDVIFAYPGGASMPMHQALTRSGTRSAPFCPATNRAASSPPRGTPASPASRAWSWPPPARGP